MRQAVRRLVVAGVALGLAGTASACGSDVQHRAVAPLAQISVSNAAAQNGIADVSPAAALDRAVRAMESTGSYRVQGTTVDGDALNIAFRVGVGSVGTIRSGNPVRLVSIDDGVYVGGDAESMEALVGDDVDGTIGEKWLSIDPESTSGFAMFADGTAFADAVLGAGDPAEITGVNEVDGKLAVGLVFPETGGTLWVAATGEPLPLRFEEKGASGDDGVLNFGDFGTDVEIAAPDEDEVLNVDELPAE